MDSKAMTLVLALKWLFEEGEAVVVSSDSKATTSLGISYEDKKVHATSLDNDRPVAIVSGSGDPSLVKWGFEAADEVLLKYAQNEYPVKFASFRSAVREIEHVFMERLNHLRSFGVEPEIQMILCGLDLSGKASIYLLDNRGLAEPRHENPGYAIIGSGFVTGGILLLRLLGYTMELDLGILTTFILDNVSEVDIAVGPFVGESYLMRLDEKKENIVLGPMKKEAIAEYKEKSAKRKEMLRKLWRLCDSIGEEEVEEILDKIAERQVEK